MIGTAYEPSQHHPKFIYPALHSYSRSDIVRRVPHHLEYEYTSVSKISCGDSSEKIIKRFEENIRVLCHMDKEVRSQLRVYDAIGYGIRYQLFYNKVVGFLIFRPEKLASLVGVNWSKCDSCVRKFTVSIRQ